MKIETVYGNDVLVNGKELTLEAALLAAIALAYKGAGKRLFVPDERLEDLRGLMILRTEGGYIIEGQTDSAFTVVRKDEEKCCEERCEECECDECEDRDECDCEYEGGPCPADDGDECTQDGMSDSDVLKSIFANAMNGMTKWDTRKVA